MTVQLGKVSEFVSEKINENSDIDPTSLIDMLSDVSEISYGTYFANPRNDRGMIDHVPLSASNYNPEWQARYIEKNYHLLDPWGTVDTRSVLSLDWPLVTRNHCPVIKQFFGEAAEPSVCASGLAFPVRDPNGGRGLFSFSLDVPDRHWESFRRENIADLMYAAFIFHDFMLRRNGYLDRKGLTQREIEVIHWIALGKTMWESALILGISLNTVRVHLANVRAKLGAANTTQAIVRCAQDGLINI